MTKSPAIDSVAEEKYFYIPLFKSGTASLNYLNNLHWCLAAYASRVMSGETLKQALSNDLRKDFGYTGKFRVNGIEPRDQINDKHGKLTNRYQVDVQLLDELDTQLAKPLGMSVAWSSPEKKYKFNVEWTETVEIDPFYILIQSVTLTSRDKTVIEKILSDWAYKGIDYGYGDGYIHYFNDDPNWATVNGKDFGEFCIDLGSADAQIATDELLNSLDDSGVAIEKVYFGEDILGIT